MAHANAALTPRHRLKLARAVVEDGWTCLAPGLMEALNPREDESHGGTEEVPRRAA